MNWSKIKTVLIALFLLIDVFLVCWNVSQQRDRQTISTDAAANTVEALAARGITVSEGLIAPKIPTMGRLIVKNALADEVAFLGKCLGKGYRKDGSRFFKDGKAVELSGNRFTLTENRSVRTEDEARRWLSDNGFDLSMTRTVKENGAIAFQTVYGEYDVFGSRITVTDEDGTAKADGCFYTVDREEAGTEVLPMTAVLPRLLAEGIERGVVTAITPGFSAAPDTAERFSEATADAVYCISFADGREFFYNAGK